ncbi:hypothetical protein N752_25640 [Desulforamulus aquiferis]|nr:hypothetical protein [Desulforamulus aquiferis]RYD02338.1 hypothetical protein N752_25640 [Desulforamulus aquiferis]
MEVKGYPVATIARGELIVEEGRFIGKQAGGISFVVVTRWCYNKFKERGQGSEN